MIVDTNVLLLLLVGLYDPLEIRNCAKTQRYSQDDFKLLKKILERFDCQIVLTPQILVEVYRHARDVFSREKLGKFLLGIVKKFKDCSEQHVGFNVLMENEDVLIRFGFTDISIIEAAKQLDAVVITDELDMYVNFYTVVPVIKFDVVAAHDIGKVPL